MDEVAVDCRDLVVRRGGVDVLRGLTVPFATGVVTGLLGPSGSGKTTLLRSIVGTQIVLSGSVTVLGGPAGQLWLRREVGYSSQSSSIYDDLTVAENVSYFAAAVGAPAGDVTRVIERVDLSDSADRLAGRLSGGQRSRVSLAIALLGRPRLVVLDEPTVGLDPVLRESLWRLFGELASDGVTLIVSSHVMEEAERCDRLVLMRSGTIIAEGTASSLKLRTRTQSMDAAFLRLVQDEPEPL